MAGGELLRLHLAELGPLFAAALGGDRAARVEGAARGYSRRVGNVAFQHDAPPLGIGVRLGGRREEGLRVEMVRSDASAYHAAPRREPASALPARAANTMAPPMSARSLGRSAMASQTQIGPSTTSTMPRSTISVALR